MAQRHISLSVVRPSRASIAPYFVDEGLEPVVAQFDFGPKELKGKCALGPFLSILVIECKHKGLNVKICSWMNKVQI